MATRYLAVKLRSSVAYSTDMGTLYTRASFNSSGVIGGSRSSLSLVQPTYPNTSNKYQAYRSGNNLVIRRNGVLGVQGWAKFTSLQTGMISGTGANATIYIMIAYSQVVSGTRYLYKGLLSTKLAYFQVGDWDGSDPTTFTTSSELNKEGNLLKSESFTTTNLSQSAWDALAKGKSFTTSTQTAPTTPSTTPASATGVNKIIQDFLNDLIAKVKAAATTAIGTITTSIPTSFTTAITTLKTTVTSLSDTIEDWAEDAKDTIAEAVGTTATKVGAKVSESIKPAITAVSTAVTNIGTSISNAVNSMKTAISNAVTGIGTTVNTAIQAVKTAITNALSGVTTKFNDALTTIKTKIDTLVTQVRTSFTNVGSTVKTAIDSAKTSAAAKLDSLIAAIKAQISALKDKVAALMTDAKEAAIALGNDAWDYLSAAFFDYLPLITKWMNNVRKEYKKDLQDLVVSL